MREISEHPFPCKTHFCCISLQRKLCSTKNTIHMKKVLFSILFCLMALFCQSMTNDPIIGELVNLHLTWDEEPIYQGEGPKSPPRFPQFPLTATPCISIRLMAKSSLFLSLMSLARRYSLPPSLSAQPLSFSLLHSVAPIHYTFIQAATCSAGRLICNVYNLLKILYYDKNNYQVSAGVLCRQRIDGMR